MHVAVVANGELPDTGRQRLIEALAAVDMVIAADGGLTHCATLGLEVQLVVGDLDSVTEDDLAYAESCGAEVRRYPIDKDATDLDLAIDAAKAIGAEELSVVAPFGGRLDHALATIARLAADDLSGLIVCGLDGRRRVDVVRHELAFELPLGTTVSLVPSNHPAVGVTTRGLQWPLTGETLDLGTTRGVSNLTVETSVRVSVERGVLLVIVDAAEVE